jgi:hypothetical protein
MAADGRPKGIGGFRNTLTLAYLAKSGLLAPESPSTTGKSRDWPTANAHDRRERDDNSTQGTNLAREVTRGQRGVLNSRWVLQLMGYPSTWCDLPVEVIARLSKRPATRSSRKSSQR